MKRLKILSRFIDAVTVRPLVAGALVVLLLDMIYVNYIFRAPSLDSVTGRHGDSGKSAITATFNGRVKDKSYDATGNVTSIVVGKMLCYVNHASDISIPPIDSYVTVRGKAEMIDGAMNPGEFDKKDYYGAKGIFYECSVESIETVRVPEIPVREAFLGLRHRLSDRILRFFVLEGGTVNTLLCGDKTTLDKERKDLYTSVGVGHFLVISGLHISAVGTFIYRGLRRLGFKVRTGCAVAMSFLIMYGILVGFSVSVIRALVMFFVRLLADVLRQIYDMMSAVSFAMLINICVNPLCVRDSAFIYSYVTVASIALYVTFLAPRAGTGKTFREKLRGRLKLPAVLWLFVLPVNLRLSYGCSLASILINACLAVFSAPILVLAFLGLVLSFSGLMFPTGVTDFLIACILRGFDNLCGLMVRYPFFTFSGRPALWKVCIYYAVLLGLLFVRKEKPAAMMRVGMLCAMIVFVASPADLSGRVTTLYVGQGECVVIHTGPGSAAIYDCGSTSKSNVGEYTVIPYLKYCGVTRVDAIFVSHGDYDHVGEVPYLIGNLPKEGIRLKTLYTQNIAPAQKSSYLITAEKAAKTAGVNVRHMSRGQRVVLSGHSFACLWPAKGYSSTDVNEGSMVILASYKDFDTLLCGDATKVTERHIIDYAGKAMHGGLEVLLVSHHGSESASDSSFLKAMSPETAVVSAGINNRYGHPHKEVLARFKEYCPDTKLLRTDRKGAVSVERRKSGISITGYIN